jgi:hypothetical protein
MGNNMLKAIFMLLMAPGMAFGAFGQATSQENVHMLELPVLIAACERDPGNRLQPGGGRFSPEQVMEEFGCDPVEDVSVTVSNMEIDFFARCETGDDGLCKIEAPTDPERELDVAIHMTTVPPGLAPKQVVNQTIHFSEFTGIGIALFPDPDVSPVASDRLPDRTTLAVNLAECEDGSNTPGCDREPVEALVQASAGDITAEGFPWLATNDEGWVSFDRASLEGETIDLMLQTDTEPRFACTDKESSERIETEWIEGREGNFIRLTPISEDDITCDVTLLDSEG